MHNVHAVASETYLQDLEPWWTEDPSTAHKDAREALHKYMRSRLTAYLAEHVKSPWKDVKLVTPEVDTILDALQPPPPPPTKRAGGIKKKSLHLPKKKNTPNPPIIPVLII